MTNTIKASEAKPGMTVKWKRGKFTHEVPVERVHSTAGGRKTWFVNGVDGMSVQSDTQVTVLSEPAPPQPEEPTEFGAKVTVAGRRMILCTDDPKEPWPWLGEALNDDPVRWSWGQLTGLGPVQVIPDQGWTVPDDTPEVPDRIEEWPEDDTELRKHKWQDADGDVWRYESDNRVGRWLCADLLWGRPYCGPWTRVTDA